MKQREMARIATRLTLMVATACPLAGSQTTKAGESKDPREIIVVAKLPLNGAFLAEVSEGAGEIDDTLWRAVQDKKARLCVVERVVDFKGGLSGEPVPGSVKGELWDQVPGGYFPKSKCGRPFHGIVVAQRFVDQDGRSRFNEDVKGVLFHEVGHAIDRLFAPVGCGALSSTGEFKTAFEADRKRIECRKTCEVKKTLAGYLQKDPVGREEIFAEAVAIHHGQASMPGQRKLFEESFKNVLAYVEKEIKEIEQPCRKGPIASAASSDRCPDVSGILLTHDPYLLPECGRAAVHLDVPADAEVRVGFEDGSKRSTLSRGKYRHFLVEGLPQDRPRTVIVEVSLTRRNAAGTYQTHTLPRSVSLIPGARKWVTIRAKDVLPEDEETPQPQLTSFVAASNSVTSSSCATTKSQPCVNAGLLGTVKFARTQPLRARVMYDKLSGGVLVKDGVAGLQFEEGSADGTPITPDGLQLIHDHQVPATLVEAEREVKFAVVLVLETEKGAKKTPLPVDGAISMKLKHTDGRQQGTDSLDFSKKDEDGENGKNLRQSILSKLSDVLRDREGITSVDIVGYLKFKDSERVVKLEEPLKLILEVIEPD